MPDLPDRPEHLVIPLAGRVFRYLRSLTGDSEAARDLTQDLLLKLHGRADAGAALVFTAARNLGLSHLRKRATSRQAMAAPGVDQDLSELVAAPEAERPDRRLEAADLRAALLAALGALPEDQRTVFHLTEIEGLRYAEVAKVLGIPPGTVASRKHHAVKHLQIELRRRGHEA